MLGCQFSTLSFTDFVLENHITVLDIDIKTILSNLNFTHFKHKNCSPKALLLTSKSSSTSYKFLRPCLTLVNVSIHADSRLLCAFFSLALYLVRPLWSWFFLSLTLTKFSQSWAICLWFSVTDLILIPLRQILLVDLHYDFLQKPFEGFAYSICWKSPNMNINIRLTMINKSMINNSIRSTYEALILLSTWIFWFKNAFKWSQNQWLLWF